MGITIKDKMQMCFNDELLNNEILTNNEKKVLATLLYSYKICKESKDNTIIRTIGALRKDTNMKQNDLYDALRSLETIYGMFERTPGEIWEAGKAKQATEYKLNFKAIFNPPTQHKKFDFSKELESPGTSMGTTISNTNTISNTMSMSNAMSNAMSNTDTNTKAVEVTNKEKNTKSNVVYDMVCNKEVETNKDKELEEKAIKGFKEWAMMINNKGS